MKLVYVVKDQNGVIVYVGRGSSEHFDINHSYRALLAFRDIDTSEYKAEIIADLLDSKEANKLHKELFYANYSTLWNKTYYASTKEIPLEVVQEYFKYDEESPTGLIWIKRPFKSRVVVGSPAGSILSKDYWQIKINRKVYKAHRIVWALVTGNCDPALVIDHIDGNGLNNRIENLRLVTGSENSINIKVNKEKFLTLPKIKDLGKVFLCRFSHRGKNYKFRVRKENFINDTLAKEALIARVIAQKEDNLAEEMVLNPLEDRLNNDVKIEIFKTFLSGKTITQTARLFNIGTSTVKRIVDFNNKIMENNNV